MRPTNTRAALKVGLAITLTASPAFAQKQTLDRALVKLESGFYDNLGATGGFGLADLLASFALFDDNPSRINSLLAEYQKVSPELIQKTAQEYLRPGNRTVLVVQPRAAAPPPPAVAPKN